MNKFLENYPFWTYAMRGVGILLLLPSLFYEQFLRWFPGLEDRRITFALFVAGVAVFMIAAIAHFLLHRRELTLREREEKEGNDSQDSAS